MLRLLTLLLCVILCCLACTDHSSGSPDETGGEPSDIPPVPPVR